MATSTNGIHDDGVMSSSRERGLGVYNAEALATLLTAVRIGEQQVGDDSLVRREVGRACPRLRRSDVCGSAGRVSSRGRQEGILLRG